MAKWVFVYGSLMDEEEMRRTVRLEGIERKKARISGYNLAINKWSVCRKSLVLGLEKDGECEGFAYRIPDDSLVCIDLREGYKGKTSGYLREEISITLLEDNVDVSGYTYVTNVDNSAFRKEPDVSEIKDKRYFRNFLSVARSNGIKVPEGIADLLYKAGLCDFCMMENIKLLTHKGKGIECSVNRCVYQDESCIVLVDRDYFVEGHLIVVFKRGGKHPDDLLDLSQEDLSSVMAAIRAGCGLISKDKSVERVYVASLNEYNHVHFHLIPRRKGDPAGFAFLFGGEYNRSRSGWEGLDNGGRIKRIEEVREIVNKVGRDCGECVDYDCSDRINSGSQ